MDTFLTILEEESIRERYHFIFAGKDNWGYGEKLSDYGNTTLLGKIPKKELFRYYHCVDVFVFPSYYEGYPKVIPEAYATGCPIIARDILDVHELADIVFEEDEELIRILNTETLQRKSTVQFPKKFNKTYQKQQYLKAVECSFE
jgi:glycosyltransferase involved in cell wall biosynthesis